MKKLKPEFLKKYLENKVIKDIILRDILRYIRNILIMKKKKNVVNQSE